jgi:hypothetical protein
MESVIYALCILLIIYMLWQIYKPRHPIIDNLYRTVRKAVICDRTPHGNEIITTKPKRDICDNAIFNERDNKVLHAMAGDWSNQSNRFENYCLEASPQNTYVKNMCMNTPPDHCRSYGFLGSWWAGLQDDKRHHIISEYQ